MPEIPKASPKLPVIPPTPEQVRDLVLSGGNIGDLTLEQRADFLVRLCQEIGVNPMLKPFDFIPGQGGKLLLYANKSLAAQLREKYNITVKKVYAGPLMIDTQIVTDIYTVEVEAIMGDRTQVEIGVSYIGGLKGADLANKIMATYTKAIRRVTLSIKGIGIPDESELEDTPTFSKAFEKKSQMKMIAPPLDNEMLQDDIQRQIMVKALKADPELIGE